MDPDAKRLKQLELLGGVGAAFLGAGVALLFSQWLQPYALPALIIGIVAHGWAMFARARAERNAYITLPRWAKAAQWACWLMILVLIFYVAIRVLS